MNTMRIKENLCRICRLSCWAVISLVLPLSALAQSAGSVKPELVLRLNHTDELLSFAVSPDGKLLATLGKDGAINVRDAEAGELRQRLAQLDSLGELGGPVEIPGVPQMLLFSPEGKTLVYRGVPFLVWEIATGKRLPVPQDRKFSTCLFAPDGNTLAGVDGKGKVVLWEVKTGVVKVTLDAHKGAISKLTFTTEGQRLLTASREDNVVKIWNWSAQKLEQTFELTKFGGVRWAMSPDGRSLAVSNEGGINSETIKIWDIQNWQLKRELKGYATIMSFSPNNEFLATMNAVGRVAIFEVATGAVKKLDSGITQKDREAGLKEMEAGKVNAQTPDLDTLAIQGLVGPVKQLNSFAFTSDSQYFRALCRDGKLAVWEARTGVMKPSIPVLNPVADLLSKLERSMPEKRKAVSVALFSPEGLVIGLASERFGEASQMLGQVEQLFQLNLQPEVKLENLSDKLKIKATEKFALSPDGKFKLKLSPNLQVIELLKASTGKLLHKFEEKKSFFDVVQFSPDGKLLLTTALSPQAAKEFREIVESNSDKEAGKSSSNSTAEKERPPAAALLELAKLSLMEKLLASDKSQSIKLWSTQTGSPVKVLQGYRGVVREARFSPDGQTLITFHQEMEDDRPIEVARLWDWSKGQLKQRIKGSGYLSIPLLHSRDGAIIISSDLDSDKLLAWDVATAKNIWELPLAQFLDQRGELDKVQLSADGKFLGRFADGKDLGLYKEEDVYKRTAVRKSDLSLWETATGKLLYQQVIELDDIFNFAGSAFSPKGRFFAVWSSGQLHIWDMQSAKLATSWNLNFENNARSESFSPDDRVFASIGIDGSIQMRNPADGNLLATITFIEPIVAATQKGTIEWVAYTPDGYYTGSAGVERYIRWQVNGQLLASETYASTYRRPEIVKAALQGDR